MARSKRKNNKSSGAAASADKRAVSPTAAARGAKKPAAAKSATATKASDAPPRPAEGADEAAIADAGRNVVDASGTVLDLAQIRIRIDGVDEKIHTLISERASLAQLVGISKSKDGLKTVDFYRPEREAQVLRMAKARNKGPLRDEEVLRLFREIMSACLAQQEPLKVAYLGPEGTFTQAAVMTHFGHSVRGLALPSIDEVFHEVEAGNADFGVVPIENSTEGTVNNTLDRFLNSPLTISGEVELRIHHNLMGNLAALEDIKRICSHPQALAQCRGWLDEHLPEVERVPVSSNAEGARRARDEKGTAAIAGETAAEVYKLKILAAQIEDRADNTTRFFVLGRKLFKSSGHDRTTLLLSVGHTDTSGALFHLLEPLSQHKVNMTRIESRPSHKRKWDYVFFIDIDGHADDDQVALALADLKKRASLFRVLGRILARFSKNPSQPTNVEHLDLGPLRRVSGTVRLPGSKSISNRILLLAALAQGTTRILDLLDSDDTRYMLEALRKLGVALEVSHEGTQVEVQGTGGKLPARSAKLFLGNAGTAFRPITAVLAFAGGEYELSGLPRMHERPIKDLVDALRKLGANIDYLGTEGYPPLAIHPPSPPAAGDVTRVSIRGDVSSQFLTALLMALPLRGQAAEVTIEGELISRPYVHITLNTMKRFGVTVAEEGVNLFRIPAGARYASPGAISVEGDASSASYFLTAGLISGLTGGGPVRVEGVGRDSIQGDVALAQTLESMGAVIEMGPHWISATAGDEVKRTGKLRALDTDLNHIPDAAMVLAVAALFADGPSTLRNIGSWRVKETDRIAAMATELRKLGAVATEGPDWLRVEPPAQLRNATIDTYEDHRIAMSFSLAALGGVTVRINDPVCVAKTFPDYFRVFGSIST